MLGLRLDAGMEAGLARIARLEGRTKSAVVRDALKSYLARLEDDAALVEQVRQIAALTPECELIRLDDAQDDLEDLLAAEEASAASAGAA